MRDNFSQRVKNILARRTGYLCSNPVCQKLTSGPHSDSAKAISIGVAAHITGAARLGARFNSQISSAERSSGSNGIWLCQTCSRLIDSDPIKYTIELLTEWRHNAEEYAKTQLEGGSANSQGQLLDPYITIPPKPPYHISRDLQLAEIRSVLLDRSSAQKWPDLETTVAISEMSGIGKSVILADIARDPEVGQFYSDSVYYFNVGREGNPLSVQSALLMLLNHDVEAVSNAEQGRIMLAKALKDKKCLILLDDVWFQSQLVPFKRLGKSVSLVFSTQNSQIAISCSKIVPIDVLSTTESEKLFCNVSGQEPGDLKEAARIVLNRCDGLPLAISMVASIGRGRESAWTDILNRFDSFRLDLIQKSPSIDYQHATLQAALDTSISDLDQNSLGLYLSLAVFRQRSPIPLSIIKRLNQASLPDALSIDEAIHNLSQRSLLQHRDFEMVAMHDLQSAHIKSKASSEKDLHQKLIDSYRNPDHQSWATYSDDGYLYENLVYHLISAGAHDEVRDLLVKSPDWMIVKFHKLKGNTSYLSDINMALQLHSDPCSEASLNYCVQLLTARQVVMQNAHIYQREQLMTLVELGRINEALDHARLRPSELAKIDGLICIAESCIDLGRPHEKIQSEIANSLGDCDPSDEEVLELHFRFKNLLNSARKASTSHFDENTLKNAKDDWHFIELLRQVIEIQVIYGAVDIDLNNSNPTLTAKLGSEAEEVVDIFSLLHGILQHCELGDHERALELINSIEPSYVRASIVDGMVTRLISKGKREHANRLFDERSTIYCETTSESSFLLALKRIVRALRNTPITKALKPIVDRRTPKLKDEEGLVLSCRAAYLSLPAEEAQIENLIRSVPLEKLERTVASFSPDRWKLRIALLSALQILVEAGSLDKALSIAKSYSSKQSKFEALARITVTLVELDPGDSIEGLQELLSHLEEFEDWEERADITKESAGRLAIKGRLKTAFEIYKPTNIDDYLGAMSVWLKTYLGENIQLYNKILIRMVEICAWQHPRWKEVQIALAHIFPIRPSRSTT